MKYKLHIMHISEGGEGKRVYRKRLRVVVVALLVAALSAAVVAISRSRLGKRAALFEGHDGDPSMPAPMLGGDDSTAMPEGGGQWGGVGPGGTFLGRSMSKRRKIIRNQKDLWSKAEQGISNLLDMAKGQWHPGKIEEGRSRTGGMYSRGASAERFNSDSDGGEAAENVNRGGGHERDVEQSRDREAVDKRRKHSLDQALSDAGEEDDSSEHAEATGRDVQALRSAIARMKDALGSTKERLEQALRRDEQREMRQREIYAEAKRRLQSRTLELAAASALAPSGTAVNDDLHLTDSNIKYDAMGHRIEWPLMHPASKPTDTDEAEESITDSISGLQKMVGAVEDDVHGLLKKVIVHASKKKHSVASLQFRQKWGDVGSKQDMSSLQSKTNTLASGASGSQEANVYMANRLSTLAERKIGDREDGRRAMYTSGRRVAQEDESEADTSESSRSEMRQLEAAVEKIEKKISSLAILPRAQDTASKSEARTSAGLGMDLSSTGESSRAADVPSESERDQGRQMADEQYPATDTWDRDDAPARRAVAEARQAARTAASSLPHLYHEAQYAAVYPSGPPPQWSLNPEGQEAGNGFNDLDTHFSTDASPRDAFRRQLSHIVRTTSGADPFELPTDLIDNQVHRTLREMAQTSTPAALSTAPSTAPSLLFTAGTHGHDAAPTEDLAEIPAIMMRNSGLYTSASTPVSGPHAETRAGLNEPAFMPIDSSSGIVYVMGKRAPHALELKRTVQLGDGRAERRTTSLAMSTNAPFSLPAIKWVPPVRPLSAQQQEYQTEEQALAAVNDAIPHIAKAAHMVQTVIEAAKSNPQTFPKEDVFY